MATISKFYLHDATSTNTGTMPSNSPAVIRGGVAGAGTEATGNTTARATSDVIGTANPDTESSITAEASSAAVQRLGHRRFVSAPLAAQTFANADGNWTFSYARSQSNANHDNGVGASTLIVCVAYLWRPSTGLQVGTATITWPGLTLAVTAETADSALQKWNATQAILDGDIIVFDVCSEFQQSMATAYTDQFAYDGTTEASTTTCASFVSPPSALTLFTASAAETSAPSLSPLTMMLNQFRPFWLPKLGFLLPDPSFPVAAATEVERPIQVYGQGVNRSSVY